MLQYLCALIFVSAFYQLTQASVLDGSRDLKLDTGYNVTLNGTNFFISGYNDIEYQTWPRCMQFCNDIGMSLASLQTEEKYNMLVNYIRDFDPEIPNRRFWTSGMRLLDEYQWTSTGEFVTFTKWSSFEGGCETSAKCCISFDINEDMTLWDCTVMYPFICEQLD